LIFELLVYREELFRFFHCLVSLKDHDCAGDAVACEELFAEADRKNVAVIESQTTLDAVRQLLAPCENGGTTPAEPLANSRAGIQPAKLNFDLFDDSQTPSLAAPASSARPLAALPAEDDIVMPQSQPERSKRREPSEEVVANPPTHSVQPKRARASQVKGSDSKVVSTSKKEAAAETPDGNRRAPKPTTGGQTMSKRQSALYDKASTALTKYQDTFSNKSIWETKPRKRSAETAVKSMESHSAKIVTIGTADSDKLVLDINQWIDDVMPRFDIITEVRTNPRDFVDPISDEKMKLLKGVGINLLSQMIIAIAADCLKNLDSDDATAQDCARKFFKVCSCSRPSKDSSVNMLGTALLLEMTALRNEHLAIQTASNFQQQLMAMFYDRIFRFKTAEKFRAAVDKKLGFYLIHDILCFFVTII
jgi:hypothetical protein